MVRFLLLWLFSSVSLWVSSRPRWSSSVDEPKGGISAVGKSGRSEALSVMVRMVNIIMVDIAIVLEPVRLSFEQ
eukprot:scaffold23928_cov54-Attheya_sp.AAC.3